MAGERRCWFAYNPEIATEYQRRYGANALGGAVDPHRLYALQGEHFSDFVREVSRIAHAKGRKLG
jgi:hypothetical protein